MTKPWTGTGLSDFNSWWPTERGRGLVYRGDSDCEFMDVRGRITVLEFKQHGEGLSHAQRRWLQVRASQPNTEVRVVRETAGAHPEDTNRDVLVWNPAVPGSASNLVPLQVFRAWCESRAYRESVGRYQPKPLQPIG